MMLEYIDELEVGGVIEANTLDFIVIGPITEESKLVSGTYVPVHMCSKQ